MTGVQTCALPIFVCSVKKKAWDIKDLVDIEREMQSYFYNMGIGFSSEMENSTLVELEAHKRTILCDREKEAHQKSRVLWLVCGDDNTPFFHKSLAHRKNINSIWKIYDDSSNLVEGSEAIAKAGIQHFETLFKEEDDLHLHEIVLSAGFFPSSVSL